MEYLILSIVFFYAGYSFAEREKPKQNGLPKFKNPPPPPRK